MLSDSVNVYSKPRSDSDILKQLNKSSVIRINETVTTQYNTWKQGQLESNNTGWIKLKQTNVSDQSEIIQYSSGLYSYRILDLACFVLGLTGFIRGFKSGSI